MNGAVLVTFIDSHTVESATGFAVKRIEPMRDGVALEIVRERHGHAAVHARFEIVAEAFQALCAHVLNIGPTDRGGRS